MEKILFTLALALLFTAAVGQMPCTGTYSSPRGDWTADWTVSSDYLYANFTVRVKTDGWVGIGFSRDRLMPMSDVIVGAASSDGMQYFVSDRYTPNRDPPTVDRYQNISNFRAEQSTTDTGTYTIMTFTRPICSNNDQDIALSEDPYLLYAWGPVRSFDGNDPNSIGGHMSTDRGASEMPINFICEIDQGRIDVDAAGITWNITWQVTADAEYVTFEIIAGTGGWVGIGFSLNRIMNMTDIIVGASDGVDGSYVSDRYAAVRGRPTVDDDQGITYENAEQVEIGGSTYTNVNFTRPTRSTDEDDLSLDNEDGIYILLAWGMEVNFDGSDPMSIAQHSMTGRAVLPNRYTFFRCGALGFVLEDDDDVPTTVATEAGAAVSATITLMLILVLIALMNI